MNHFHLKKKNPITRKETLLCTRLTQLFFRWNMMGIYIFHVQYDHSSFQQLKIYGFFSDDLNEVSNKRTWDSRIRLAKKSWDDSRIRLAKKWDSRIRLGKSIMILISSNIQITFFFFNSAKKYGMDWDKRIRLAKKSWDDSRIRLAKKSWNDSRIRLAKKFDSRIRLAKKDNVDSGK